MEVIISVIFILLVARIAYVAGERKATDCWHAKYLEQQARDKMNTRNK